MKRGVAGHSVEQTKPTIEHIALKDRLSENQCSKFILLRPTFVLEDHPERRNLDPWWVRRRPAAMTASRRLIQRVI
jgi:hypothetical protein